MIRKLTKLFSFFIILALVLGLLSFSGQDAQAAGTVSLTTLGSPYTENFDTLANTGTSSTVPNGWDFLETGTNANTTYTAGTGSSTTGDTYSFGSSGSTERAFGGLLSGSLNPTKGASFTNNTGATIGTLAISYTGEMWRAGVTNRGAADRLDFQLSTDATSLSTGTWTDYDSLDFNSPNTNATAGALDGNASGNRTAISYTITGLSIADGANFWIRWTDFNISSSDDGLAVDDFSLTPDVSNIPTGVGAASPSSVYPGGSSLLTVTVTPGANPTSTGLAVVADLSSIGGSAAQAFFDDGTNGDVTAGDDVFSYQATVSNATSPGLKSLPATITDAEARSGSATISLNVLPPLYSIHDIQGAGHISPLNGAIISTSGIVTALRTNGFYMEEPVASWDSDEATSEGIFVFTSSAPAVSVSDEVLVTGTVQEFRSGGSSGPNLTITEISTPGRTVTVQSSGNPLPDAVVIGTGGRLPPSTIIEDDATGDVETSGIFDPASDGIDFYESLEDMRVQVNDAVAVGPWHDFGSNRELPVVGDNGANASVRSARGGVIAQASDFNPERIILNDLISGGPTLSAANVSDSFPGAILGVIDYNFGNFKLEVTSMPGMSSGGLTQETTTAQSSDQLAVGTFNVENLDPNDPPSKFAELAGLIVDNLQSPDLLAVEEIQDNNGPTDNGVVDASTTYGLLISAIQAAGGPTYDFRQVDPTNDEDGGEPGGNIRQGFLFRTDRGLSFIDRPGAVSTTANAVVGSGSGTQLQYSPGRIDPTNVAFTDSRKPLAGEFSFNGHHFFVIANHFNSKGGDDPLFGRFQPPTFASEVQRHQQAQVVHDFVQSIEGADPNANVIVLGDLNDYQFSTTLSILTAGVLSDLIDSLPTAEQYTYVFDGNSEVLDHTLLSDNLFDTPFEYDVVHVNSEYALQASDHEPQVVRLLSYNPSAFFPPVANLPVLNLAKAGSSIPVKFSLNGFKGLDVIASGYPQTELIACDANTPMDSIEQTASAGSSGLSYDPTTDLYTYIWKTAKSWAGTCRQLVVRLIDGSFLQANFQFK